MPLAWNLMFLTTSQLRSRSNSGDLASTSQVNQAVKMRLTAVAIVVSAVGIAHARSVLGDALVARGENASATACLLDH